MTGVVEGPLLLALEPVLDAADEPPFPVDEALDVPDAVAELSPDPLLGSSVGFSVGTGSGSSVESSIGSSSASDGPVVYI